MPQLDLYSALVTSFGLSSFSMLVIFTWMFFTALALALKLVPRFSAKVVSLGFLSCGGKFFARYSYGLSFFVAQGDLLEQFILAGVKFNGGQYLVGLSLALAGLYFGANTFSTLLIAFVAGTIRDLTQDLAAYFLRALLFMSSIALIVLFYNLAGVLPLAFTVTSTIAAPAFLAVVVFFACLFILVLKFGFSLFGGLLPQGTNAAIAPLIVLIEIVSNVAKFFSLAVRLFANMFAGHLLLKVFYVILYDSALSQTTGAASAITFGTLFLVFFVSLLELMIAALQAFVFLLLVTLYVREMEFFIIAH